MRYLVWILRLAAFIVILMFALNNTAPVDVKLFNEHTINSVPLIVVMLVMVVIGSVIGWFIALPSMLRYRRHISKLKRENNNLEQRLKKSDASLVPGQETVAQPKTVTTVTNL